MPNFFGDGIISLLIGFIIIFAYIAFHYRDKYNKKQDELFELANTQKMFSKRSSVMRDDERKLFDILMSLYGDKYFIFPLMGFHQ